MTVGTGYIVADEVSAVAAVSRLHHLSRKRVRAGFIARFTAPRMAEDYLAIYGKLARQHIVTDT